MPHVSPWRRLLKDSANAVGATRASVSAVSHAMRILRYENTILSMRRSIAMFGSGWWGERTRSEEHTSELQSRGHLVCRLLLEKQNQIRRKNYRHSELRNRF